MNLETLGNLKFEFQTEHPIKEATSMEELRTLVAFQMRFQIRRLPDEWDSKREGF